eukprot:1915880-Rhodomonas_salina.1
MEATSSLQATATIPCAATTGFSRTPVLSAACVRALAVPTLAPTAASSGRSASELEDVMGAG